MAKSKLKPGTPEFMAMIRKKRGKGKRKGPTWKKKMHGQVKTLIITQRNMSCESRVVIE